MKRGDFHRHLPTLLRHYAVVAPKLDNPPTKRPRKISYRAVMDEFLAKRNQAQTALAFRISKNMVWLIVYRALTMAEKLAGIDPLAEAKQRPLMRLRGKKGLGRSPVHTAKGR